MTAGCAERATSWMPQNAARVVLAGNATAIPKSADGMVEMLKRDQGRQGHLRQSPDLGHDHPGGAGAHRTP